MNAKSVVFGALVFGLASTALSINDAKQAVDEYRWIVVDGPYACPSKEDLRQITKHHTDEIELQMVDELRAYYLIAGTIAQLVQEDSASGMSQIHLEGITRDLWTCTRFLSKRPVKDPYGVVETPETFGLSAQVTSTSDTRERSGATPAPSISAQPTASPAPRTMPAKP
ncbi:MAG: hypothetical protein QOH31_5843 [Verrucomicrobiota bacterium]|jgi:hypothetical protein